jgi:2-methylaconitate cis-trans-isomerase PrpF
VPTNAAVRDKCILRALGSPDPQAMQLDGVGGGISSTSKVAILRPSKRPGFDVDYTFGQVPLRSDQIDWDGSCGNLAAAVGLYAAKYDLVAKDRAPQIDTDADTLTVNVWQENLGHAMAVHVPRACQQLPGEPAQQLAQHQLITIPGVATVSGGRMHAYVRWGPSSAWHARVCACARVRVCACAFVCVEERMPSYLSPIQVSHMSRDD